MELKILSFNIHKGMSWHSGRPTLMDLRSLIRESNADIVFLQEVHGQNERERERMHVDFDSQYEFLADQVWQHYCYAKNAVYDHGHHGNVILSQYPIVEWHKQDISTNRWEQRGILSAKIDLNPDQVTGPKTYLQAYCVHLNLFPKSRLRQFGALEQKILTQAEPDMPLILAGDFNDWNQHAEKILASHLHLQDCHHVIHGKYAKTFPSLLPMLPLDRIYVRNAEVKSAQTLQGASGISDHLPLTAVIRVPGPFR